MLLFIVWQSMCAISYFYSYGTMALLLGFTHSWSVIMAFVLWRIVITLPQSKIHGINVTPHQVVGTPLLPSDRSKPMNEATGEILSPS